MEPKSLSATALHVHEQCPARYKAEHIDRSKGFGGTAASVGSTVHGALEMFVKECYIEHNHKPTLKLLQDFYHLSYIQTFGSHDTGTEEYLDGLEIISRWFARPGREEYFATARIVSCEVKTFFEIPTSIGPIPFNYIWDRFDEMKPNVFKVVDYKGLALDTPIPTPSGWTTIEKLQPGDEVIGGNGKPCRVKVKSEVHLRKCYEIEFDDGTSIICDDEHRWALEVGAYYKSVVWTAEEIARRGVKVGRQKDIRIPTVTLDLPEADLPIDPYVLGAWIGDGSASCGIITKPLESLFDEIKARDYEVGEIVASAGGRTVFGLRTQLRLLGLLNNKHIPEIYLRGSYLQRYDLLCGIMDTDGHWNPLRKRAVLNTTNKYYAEQVYELVVSLGWTANIFATQADAFGKKWDAWQLWFTPTGAMPFYARNQDAEIPTSARSKRRLITAITEVPTVATQCIEVDSEDNCFLAGKQMVKTHNTNRWNIRSDDLQKKIQARCYGLAAAIQLKKEGITPDRVWVEFDMLRHEPGPVGRVFTREDNAATWKFLKDSAEAIIATKDDEVEERLNPECLFCVRKATCRALQKNVTVGGIHSIPTIEQAIDLRAQLEWQKKGLDSLIKDLDNKILTEAKERDLEEFESDMNKLKVTVSAQRAVDAEMVEKAIGPTLFERFGKKAITMSDVDKLLKGKQLTPEQKADLRGLIYMKRGEPRVKIDPKNPIDED